MVAPTDGITREAASRIRIRCCYDVLRTQSAQEPHLLGTAHELMMGSESRFPQLDDHASNGTGSRSLHRGQMPSTARFMHQPQAVIGFISRAAPCPLEAVKPANEHQIRWMNLRGEDPDASPGPWHRHPDKGHAFRLAGRPGAVPRAWRSESAQLKPLVDQRWLRSSALRLAG
jgi:hypothetical protein